MGIVINEFCEFEEERVVKFGIGRESDVAELIGVLANQKLRHRFYVLRGLCRRFHRRSRAGEGGKG